MTKTKQADLAHQAAVEAELTRAAAEERQRLNPATVLIENSLWPRLVDNHLWPILGNYRQDESDSAVTTLPDYLPDYIVKELAKEITTWLEDKIELATAEAYDNGQSDVLTALAESLARQNPADADTLDQMYDAVNTVMAGATDLDADAWFLALTRAENKETAKKAAHFILIEYDRQRVDPAPHRLRILRQLQHAHKRLTGKYLRMTTKVSYTHAPSYHPTPRR